MSDFGHVDLQAIVAMMPFAQSTGLVVISATPGEVVGYLDHRNGAPPRGCCTGGR